MKTRPVVLFLLSATIFSGCRFLPSTSQKFSGTLEMTEHSVGPRVPGRVDTLSVKEGDEVKKGELLATLDRYAQAKKDFARLGAIYKSGGVTDQALEHARLELEDQTVVSPMDGVVLVKVRETGEVVPAGGAIAVLGDNREYWVRIYVPEGVISRLKMEQDADVKVDGLKKVFSGHVSYIAPRAEFTPRNVQTTEERVTQTFAVKVAVEDPEKLLRPGVSADVELRLN